MKQMDSSSANGRQNCKFYSRHIFSFQGGMRRPVYNVRGRLGAPHRFPQRSTSYTKYVFLFKMFKLVSLYITLCDLRFINREIILAVWFCFSQEFVIFTINTYIFNALIAEVTAPRPARTDHHTGHHLV